MSVPMTSPVPLSCLAKEMVGSPVPHATSRIRIPASTWAASTIASVTFPPMTADCLRHCRAALARPKSFQSGLLEEATLLYFVSGSLSASKIFLPNLADCFVAAVVRSPGEHDSVTACESVIGSHQYGMRWIPALILCDALAPEKRRYIYDIESLQLQ